MSDRFGQYEIIRKLATGGMAEVFLAKQTGMAGFERHVCIKRILPHLSEQQDFIDMFQDEARIAANLIHPNIAQIYDIGTEGDSHYIAMEYVRGEDLRRVYNQEVSRGRAMPFEPAAQIIMGSAAGLDFAHRHTNLDGKHLGLVHRDISPQNIIVTYDGHAKIVDFGVAKAAGKVTETRSGVLKGKYSYMSPEQASGDPVDSRTDIFALGITLYEVTTGTRLFKRENEIETLHAVIGCDVTLPTDLVPDYPEDLEYIVMRALSADPSDRYTYAGDMERDLEQFLINRGHPSGASSLATYMQDLFSEKLADEMLFGGPVWEENMTPAPSKRSKRSKRSKKTAEAPTDIKPIGEADATIIEDSAGGEKSNSRKDDPWAGMAEEWTEAQGVDRDATETQGASENNPSIASQVMSSPLSSPIILNPAHRSPLSAYFFMILLVIGAFGSASVAGYLFATTRQNHGLSQNSGTLLVDSEPRVAWVKFEGDGANKLNARYQNFITPFNITEGLPVGHNLKAKFSWKDKTSVLVVIPAVESSMVPPPLFASKPDHNQAAQTQTSLRLISVPSGASIFVDNKKLDIKTPAFIPIKGGESHTIEYQLDGYSSRSEKVYVEAGKVRIVEFQLYPTSSATKTKETPPAPAPQVAQPGPKPKASPQVRPKKKPATLSITAPLKLKVYVGKRYLGDTPIHNLSLAAGTHNLRFRHSGEGLSFNRKVRLTSAKSEHLDIQLRKGRLMVNARPWAWVQIGKKPAAESPFNKELWEGTYKVIIECGKTRQHHDQTVTIVPGSTKRVKVKCK
ncbi:serine/threonine protein kinase [Myxococcota bacterium]|nr:serine/threonine protein kinase [Myxococcota bacterium]